MRFLNLISKTWQILSSKVTSKSNKEKKQPYSKALYPIILKKEDAAYSAVTDLQEALKDEKVKNIALTGPYGSGKSSVIETLLKENKCHWPWEEDKKHHYLKISLATLDACKEKLEKQENQDTKPTDKKTTISDQTLPPQPDKGEQQKNPEDLLNRRIEYSILQQLIYKETRCKLPNSRLKRIPYIPKIWLCVFIGFLLFWIGWSCILFAPKWLPIETLLSKICINQFALELVFVITSCILLVVLLWKIINICNRTRFQRLKIAGHEIEMKEENSIFNHHLDEILYFFQSTNYDVVIIEDLDRFDTTEIFLKLRELNYLINNSKMIRQKPIRFIYAIKDDMFDDSSRTKFFDYITAIIPVISFNNSKDILLHELEQSGHKDEISIDTIREIAFFIDDMRLLKNIVNEYDQYQKQLHCDGFHRIDNKQLLAMITYKNYHPDDFALLAKRQGNLYQVFSPEKRDKFIQLVSNTILAERKQTLEDSKKAYERTQHLNEKELRRLYVLQYVSHMQSGTISIKIDNGENRDFSHFWETEEAFQYLTTDPIISYNYRYRYMNQWRDATANLEYSFENIQKEVSHISYQDRLNAIRKGKENIEQQKKELLVEETLLKNYTIRELIQKFQIYKYPEYANMHLSDMANRFVRIGLITEDYYDYISHFYEGMMSIHDHQVMLDMKLERNNHYTTPIDNIDTFVKELPDDVFLHIEVLNVYILDYLAKNHKKENAKYNLIIELLKTNHPFEFITVYDEFGKQQKIALKAYIQSDPQKIWKLIKDTQYEEKMQEIWIRYCTISDIKEEQLQWINTHFKTISKLYPLLSKEIKEYVTTQPKYTTLALESEILPWVIKHKAYDINSQTVFIKLNYKQAYGNIGLLSTDEQTIALQNNWPRPTWQNVVTYYKAKEQVIDTALITFIDSQKLDLGRTPYNAEEEIKHSLFQSLMNSNDLNMEAYKSICQSFKGTKFDTSKSAALAEERIEWLIRTDFVAYTENNTQNIQDYFSANIVFAYIMYYKSKFIRDIDSYIYDENLAYRILNTDKLTPICKIKIIQHINVDEIIMTDRLATIIGYLYKQKQFNIHEELLNKVISKTSAVELSIEVATLAISKNPTHTFISNILKLLPEPYSGIVNGRPFIKSTPVNNALQSVLENAKYAIFHPDKKRDGYRSYRVNQ